VKPLFPDLSSFLDDAVYPSLFDRLDLAFPEFGWKRNRKGGWTATNRDTTKRVVDARPDRVVCNQPVGFYVHGGDAIRWLDYVNGGNQPRGADFPEAVRLLAGRAEVPFPEIEWTDEQKATARRTARVRNLHEDFWAVAQAELASPRGEPIRRYLEGRGFTEDEIPTLPLGCYPSRKHLLKSLEDRGYDRSELAELPGLDAATIERGSSWWDGRLVGVWRTRHRKIQCFWARDPEWSEGAKAPKYLYHGPSEGFYGLDVALQSHERPTLLVVEGLLDVVHLQARGFHQVVALGGKGDRLSPDRWRELVSYGVDAVTLGLDADESGIEGCRKAVDNLTKVRTLRKVYLLDVSDLGVDKDPDGYLREHGIEAFTRLVDEAEHFYRVRARDILERHRPAEGWTDPSRDAVLTEALSFYEHETEPANEDALQKYFLPAITEATGATDIGTRLEELRRRRHHERVREEELAAYREFVRTTEGLLASGDVGRIKGHVRNEMLRLQQIERNVAVAPPRCLDGELALLEERLEKWRGSEFIGLAQRTLPGLDVATSGLRGLMLLAAPPNVGKTALAVQLGMDVVAHNPDTCFLFLSLEMPRIDIYARMMCRWAEMDWKTLTFGSGTGKGGTYSFEEYSKLAGAREKFTTLGRRIRVLDETNFPEPTVDAVLAEVEELKASTGTSRVFVLVDYLQVWPVAGVAVSELEQDKQRIGAMKTLKTLLGDQAVMVISEARKPSVQGSEWGGALADVMGSARGSYTPDIVFLFHPWSDTEMARSWNLLNSSGKITNPEAFEEKLRTLEREGRAYHWLNIAKGRDGVTKKMIPLTFWYRQAAFEEGVEE